MVLEFHGFMGWRVFIYNISCFKLVGRKWVFATLFWWIIAEMRRMGLMLSHIHTFNFGSWGGV